MDSDDCVFTSGDQFACGNFRALALRSGKVEIMLKDQTATLTAGQAGAFYEWLIERIPWCAMTAINGNLVGPCVRKRGHIGACEMQQVNGT